MSTPYASCHWSWLTRLFVLPTLLCGAFEARAESTPAAVGASAPIEGARESAHIFDEAAGRALTAMKQRAETLHVTGVAVVAYAEGDAVSSWSSRMVVVGKMTSPPSEKSKGDNLLGIAYAKAAEMAATLKDSGSGVRPPYVGEFGWQGGVVAKGRTGWLIVAFSGGPSEDDVKISKAGLEILAAAL
jgi:hypothetical protein